VSFYDECEALLVGTNTLILCCELAIHPNSRVLVLAGAVCCVRMDDEYGRDDDGKMATFVGRR
jgi:hypothetical protein